MFVYDYLNVFSLCWVMSESKIFPF